MAVKSLREINETRNIESSIDENTLSSGETSGGFFGTFKIFEAVKKAVNWLTNITGNKTFEGNVQINGTLNSNNVSSNIIACVGTLKQNETLPVTYGDQYLIIGCHPYYNSMFIWTAWANNSFTTIVNPNNYTTFTVSGNTIKNTGIIPIKIFQLGKDISVS